MSAEAGSKRPLAIGLALLFLALLLAGLGARFWATNRIIDSSGPTHIAADGGQVLLFAAGNLLQLSGEGALRAVIPVARTGLQGDPVDLRFTAAGDLLVVAQRPAAARLCDIAYWNCRPVAGAVAGLVERQLKLLQGARPGEWLLSDARGDTLWRLSPGEPPVAVLPSGTLAGPNDLALAEDGALWVADTDHRRLVELVPDDAGGFVPGREHSAVNEHTVGRSWYPLMLARAPDGRWWVTQAAEFSEARAEVLVYDPEKGAQGHIELPPGAYPTDVVAFGDSMLVTDMDRYAVYRVAGEAQTASRFGDEAFLRHLGQIRERRDRFQRLSHLSLATVIVLGGLMIGAAILATPREKRWTRVPPPFDWASAPAEAPHIAGIHWLKPDPAIERSLKWAERLGYLVFALPALGALGLYVWLRARAGPVADPEVESKLEEAALALLLCGVLLGLLIPVIRKSLQALRTRVGTDGRRLYIRRHDGREIAVDPEQLAYTDRMILYREYSLPLTGGRQKSVYEQGEVETWLAPLLRRARRLSPAQALKHLWKHGDRSPLWWLAGAAIVAAVLIAALSPSADNWLR